MLNIKSTEIHINKKCRAGNLLFRFQSDSLVFCPKMSKWAIRSKKWAIHSFAHFWWATWAIHSRSLISSERHEWIAYGRSFLVSDLSDSLTSLICGEQPERFTHIAHQNIGNERFDHFFNKKIKKSYIKCTKNRILDFFSQHFLSKSLICSFPQSDLSESLMVAHFSWATWAIHSQSLISSQRPERFTHRRSFVLSDLSESLTVAHLIWAKWVNERMSNERMSEFPAVKKCEKTTVQQ